MPKKTTTPPPPTANHSEHFDVGPFRVSLGGSHPGPGEGSPVFDNLAARVNLVRDRLADLMGVCELLEESNDLKVINLAAHVTTCLSDDYDHLGKLLDVLALVDVRATPELLEEYPELQAPDPVTLVRDLTATERRRHAVAARRSLHQRQGATA